VAKILKTILQNIYCDYKISFLLKYYYAGRKPHNILKAHHIYKIAESIRMFFTYTCHLFPLDLLREKCRLPHNWIHHWQRAVLIVLLCCWGLYNSPKQVGLELHHEHYFLLATFSVPHLGAFSGTPDLVHHLTLKQFLSPMVVYEERPSILVCPLRLQRIHVVHA
jgi:hypothetical protein